MASAIGQRSVSMNRPPRAMYRRPPGERRRRRPPKPVHGSRPRAASCTRLRRGSVTWKVRVGGSRRGGNVSRFPGSGTLCPLPKVICKQSAEIASPFDNVRDFLEVDVFETIFVRFTFDGLNEDNRGFGKMLFFERQLFDRPSPTGNYAGKCLLVQRRVVEYKHEFNPRCRETM